MSGVGTCAHIGSSFRKVANMAVRTILTAGLLFACSALALTANLTADDQLPWAEDFAAACQQANAQGKLVLLHFYSDDCPPCVRVEKNVFSQPEVGAAVGRNFVPVKVHARKTPALVQKYHVQQWPTDVFVTPAGLELTRTVSPQAPAAYINLVNTVAASSGIGVARSAAPGTITQVSNQIAGQATYMTQSAAATAQQYQQSAQQSLAASTQAAQQAGQQAQQTAQQSWQYAQAQGNQALANTQQAVQQTAQTAQQSTQAAADSAKEVINRYSQPLQQAAAATWQPPFSSAAATPASADINAAPSVAAAVQQHYAPNFAPQAPAAPAAAPPVPANVATAAYPVAMEGYCPVTLATERKWKKGQAQFGAVHRRRTFLFVSQAEQQKFLADPDRYSPVMVGYDPVKFMQTGELVDGKATFSLTYRKQVYLFTDDASLKSFWTSPAQFTEGLRQAMSQTEGRTIR